MYSIMIYLQFLNGVPISVSSVAIDSSIQAWDQRMYEIFIL
jgi:hypothetical protein